MAGAVPTLWWFDRFDDRIGILPVEGAAQGAGREVYRLAKVGDPVVVHT